MLRTRARISRKLIERGMVAVQVVICLAPLCGVTALAIDGGMMYEYRRRVQATADAAAFAAAADLYKNYATNAGLDPGGTARSSATLTATANGFTTNSTLTLNIPPLSGPYSGKAGYAEAILVYNMPRGFSSILDSGSLPIQARAVARGLQQSNGIGLLILDPSSQGALTDSGGATVNVAGSIIVDSTNAKGAIASGPSKVTAPKLIFSGTPGYNASGSASFNGAITSGATPTPDPLASLPAPSMSGMTVQGNNYQLGGGTAVLNPGIYNGGITISSSSASAILNPGIYYLNGGGLTVSGGGSLTAIGVMFYNDGGSNGKFTISGGSTITISPPTSGIYQGITLFQNRTSTAAVTVSGGSTSNISGSFYSAAAAVTVSGGSASNMVGSQYVCKDLTVSGSGTVAIGTSAGGTPTTRLYGLVE